MIFYSSSIKSLHQLHRKGRYYTSEMTDSQLLKSEKGQLPKDKATASKDGKFLRKKPDWKVRYSDIVKYTPSRLEHISYEDELMQRAKGVNFIFQAGAALNLDPALLVHAAVFLHRFYLRFGTKRCHYYVSKVLDMSWLQNSD